MAIPNPQTWTSMNLMDQGQMQIFLQQLAQWATQQQNPVLALNSAPGSIQGGSLLVTNKYLNAVTGTQTVDCSNATNVMVEINFTATTVLALSNLSVGVPVVVKANNTTAGAHIFRMSATAPGGTAYAISAKSSSSFDNMVTGISVPATTTLVFAGNSDLAGATPSLWLVYN